MARPDTGRLRAALAAAAEDAVIDLARAGDTLAFEELIRHRQGALRQLLRRLCNDAGMADDLAQETFVRAWQGLHTLRANAALWRWLRRIAVRSWLQQVQRNGPATAAGMDVELEAGSHHDEPARSDRLDLDAALARLAPAPRACMVLAYQAGMSQTEIAESLQLPLGTVKTQMNRSTALLKQRLAGE